MLIDKMLRRYMAEEGDNGGSNGGGTTPPANNPTDKTDPPANNNNSQHSDKEAELLKEVMAKKKTIGEQNATIAQLQEQLKKFDGIDPEAVRTLLAKQKEEADKELERKGEYERLKAQMIDAHQKEVGTLNETINAIKEQLNSITNQNAELTVGNAFANSLFIKGETVLTAAKTRKLYGDYFAYEDGKVVGYDKPAGSKERTILVDGMGNPLSFDEALKKVIESDPEKDTILRSKAKRGANSGTLPKTTPHNPPSKLSSVEKIQKGLRELAKAK